MLRATGAEDCFDSCGLVAWSVTSVNPSSSSSCCGFERSHNRLEGFISDVLVMLNCYGSNHITCCAALRHRAPTTWLTDAPTPRTQLDCTASSRNDILAISISRQAAHDPCWQPGSTHT